MNDTEAKEKKTEDELKQEEAMRQEEFAQEEEWRARMQSLYTYDEGGFL